MVLPDTTKQTILAPSSNKSPATPAAIPAGIGIAIMIQHQALGNPKIVIFKLFEHENLSMERAKLTGVRASQSKDRPFKDNSLGPLPCFIPSLPKQIET